MKHIISAEDVSGFDASVMLASSSSDMKKLFISSNINNDNNEIVSHFYVTVKGVEIFRTSNLKKAIESYNNV